MIDLKFINEMQKKYGIIASKRFGQNFLIDQNIIRKIIETADVENKDVVEVGPGMGSITYPLLELTNSLTCYEIDEKIIKYWNSEISNDKLTLRGEDFLKSNFDWTDKKTFVSNIPYNITSDIFFKIFQSKDMFESATVMLQKEVAQRLTAKYKTSNYGKFSVVAQTYANIELKFDVSPQCFKPAPKVTSSVIRMTFKDIVYNIKFNKFIMQCFSMQRKTLWNNLKKNIDKEKFTKMIKAIDGKENIRPQEISPEQYLVIFGLY